MRTAPLIPLAALALLSGACSAPPPSDPALTEISGVSVIDVAQGRAVTGQDIVLRDGRIVWVGPDGQSPLPEPGRRIEAAGLYALPGLWDSHVHVFSAPDEPDTALPLYILHGVTSVRDMGATIPLGAQREVSDAVAAGERVGPRIIHAGALIDGPPGSWPGQMVAATPGEGRAHVREAAALGWTSVKAYSLLGRDTYFAIAEEADALGLPLYGHVPETVTLKDAVTAGQDVLEHFGWVTSACSTQEDAMAEGARAALASDDPFPALMAELARHSMITYQSWDKTLCDAPIRALVDAEVAIAPTLMVADFYLGDFPKADDPRMLTLPADVRAAWGEPDFRLEAMTDELRAVAPLAVMQDRETFKLAHDAGVVMLASTDAAFLNPFLFHGATLLDELDRYAEIGLSSQDVLATATLNPARLFGEDGESGALEKGQRADIILLRDNPLETIAAIRQLEVVVANGRVFDRNALDALHTELRDRAEAPKDD